MSGSKSSLSAVNYIIGISDGLLLPVIPCGLMLLLLLPNAFSLSFILINIAILVGSLTYGLARFIGEKEEIKHHHPDIARQELLQDESRLKQIGIDESLVNEMMQQAGEEQALWLKEVKENEMGWDRLDTARAGKSGLQTGLGFLMGVYLMILPFFLLFLDANLIFMVILIELILLFLFGWLKGKYIYNDPVRHGILHLSKGILLFVCLGIAVFFLAGWLF